MNAAVGTETSPGNLFRRQVTNTRSADTGWEFTYSPCGHKVWSPLYPGKHGNCAECVLQFLKERRKREVPC